MRHTISMTRCWLGRVLALTLAAFAAGAVQAQGPEGPASVLIVPVGQTRTVEMSTKNPIMEVRSDNPKVASVKTLLEDPRRVLVTGLAPGTTRVTLTDNTKKIEGFEVRVPPDDEMTREENRKKLLELIRQAVPTASVDVIASANNTVLLAGVVANVEHVTPIVELTKSIFGANANVVNSMRIGGVHQVQLDVVVANVSRSEARNMSFSFLAANNNGSTQFSIGSLLKSATLTNGTTIASQGAASALQFGSTGGNIPISLVTDKASFLGFLEALRTEGLAKVMAQPTVVTLSGRPAFINSGGETPILTSSGQGAPNVTYKRFGTVVNFLPIVLGNGKIHLEVSPEISALNQANGIFIAGITPTSVPGFDNRSAQVTVQMEDGETLAIGGLIQNTINGTASKVPILGDLPFVGAAFRTMSYQEKEEELLILVTPRLVAPMGCDQLPRQWPGRHTRSPDDFELFLEGILEAPRGQRTPCGPGLGNYTAAHKIGPTAGAFPCGDATQPWRTGNCIGGRCAPGACGPNGCSYPSSSSSGQLLLPGNDTSLSHSPESSIPAPLPNLPVNTESGRVEETPPIPPARIAPPTLPPAVPGPAVPESLPDSAPPPPLPPPSIGPEAGDDR